MDILSIMNVGFTICLSFTILFSVISIILFFFFDIRTIFSIRTGRAQAKTVKEMSEANASTGRLRVGGKTQTSKLGSTEKGKKGHAPVPTPVNTYENNNSSYEGYGGDVTEALGDSSPETEVLTQNNYVEDGGTVLLKEITQDVQRNREAVVRDIHFTVTKKIIHIHTNEVI